MKVSGEHLYPEEPSRFTPENFDGLLAFATNLNASDITLQTNEEVYAEVFGRLFKITKRKLTNTEVGDLLNSIYGPNGTTQLLSGQDVDTHYEIRPGRNERYRFRVNGTACQVEGHSAMQLTLRTIPNEPPTLASMNLPEHIIAALAPKDGVVYVTGATGSGKTTLLAAVICELAEDLREIAKCSPTNHRSSLFIIWCKCPRQSSANQKYLVIYRALLPVCVTPCVENHV